MKYRIIIVFFIIFDLSYFIFYIIKFSFSCIIVKEIKDKWPWFMVYDIFNLFFLFSQNVSYIVILFEIFKNKENKYILTEFKDIKIDDYELCKNFGKLNTKEKYDFILDKAKNYKYKLTPKQIDLIILINDIRTKYNIKKLYYEEKVKIPDFILNESTEILLDETKNFFKISTNEYLFRYQKNQFKNYIKNNNSQIINILLKESLNSIKIIEQGNFDLF